MTSKLKKLKDLERKLTVSVPVEEYDSKFKSKINNIKGQAKLDGFRKGKVPNDVLEQRYGASIHADVVNELIQKSYPEALKENNIRPASAPEVALESEDPKKPISYSATFEIFPEISPKLSSWTKYENISISIEDEDIDLAIKDIVKRYGEWEDVTRKSQKDDQVIIDFTGMINGEEFEGNSSVDFKLVLGSNSMIPGFEDSIVGKEPSEFKITSKFPDDYFKKDLAGVEAEFNINLKTVQELKVAKVDEQLFSKLDMEVKDEDEFKEEISNRMKKEVKTQEKDLTKESMYETLLKTNSFSVPKVTVKEQADLMRKDALMRIGHSEENAGDDLFPVDSFIENAEKRVKLDLLFAELVNHFELTVDKDKLDVFIDKEATKYKDADQFKQWIAGQPQQLEQFRMMALEEQLVENLENALKSKDKVIRFSELANK
ncbi:trigger factor [Gammaproteobacteria bacterium]|nr:trigger factor [Gammaproteobacteria bacterium]MDA7857239.1 trigger factor [Gammaproteobacteria bacterium]MDA8808763.1 trigger factor [Gammaproteobacteria bacterium]MDA9932274.1 trigger factor [Gammaproteobacteria bacterium]MDC0440015.1 trigger factor [Gammaproteobacteria bacterium]